jgi:negative regulator of replication initiation
MNQSQRKYLFERLQNATVKKLNSIKEEPDTPLIKRLRAQLRKHDQNNYKNKNKIQKNIKESAQPVRDLIYGDNFDIALKAIVKYLK